MIISWIISYLLTPGSYNPSWVLASRTILLYTVLSWAAVSIFWTPRDSRSLWMLSCYLIRGLPLGLFPSGDFSQTDFMIREWSLCITCPAHHGLRLLMSWTIFGDWQREISEFEVGPNFVLIRRHVLGGAKDNSKNFPFEPQQRFFVVDKIIGTK